MNRPAGSPTPITDRGDPPRRPGLASRRVLAWSFGISAALHLAVLLVYPGLYRSDERRVTPVFVPAVSGGAPGMEVLRIVEVDEIQDADAPAEPVLPTPVERPAVSVDPRAPGVGEGRDPLVPPGPTAAERLRVNLRDARLWSEVDPSLLLLSTEQRLELELAGRLEAWNDSVRAAEAARRALTDWTVTDGQGGRWGFADGKVYLGDMALPLPFSFGMNPQQLQEARQREWEWLEIQRGAATGELRDSWKERAQAIRERRDRERARADTSGVRR